MQLSGKIQQYDRDSKSPTVLKELKII